MGEISEELDTVLDELLLRMGGDGLVLFNSASQRTGRFLTRLAGDPRGVRFFIQRSLVPEGEIGSFSDFLVGAGIPLEELRWIGAYAAEGQQILTEQVLPLRRDGRPVVMLVGEDYRPALEAMFGTEGQFKVLSPRVGIVEPGTAVDLGQALAMLASGFLEEGIYDVVRVSAGVEEGRRNEVLLYRAA